VKRRSVVLASNAVAVALLFCCSLPGACKTTSPKPPARIAICVEDPAVAHNPAGSRDPQSAYCRPGAFQAQHSSQVIRAMAYDTNGHLIPDAKLTLTVSGANPSTSTVTAVSGIAQLTYSGNNGGDDSITGAFSDGSAATTNTAVVRWLNQSAFIRPIMVVHGIDEDASDYVAQIDDSFTDSERNTRYSEGDDAGEQVFTSVIGGLKMKYNPQYIEAFCYVDDQAYVNTPSGCRTPDPAQCSTQDDCVSQSSVDLNAVELAKAVKALSAQAQGGIDPSHPGTNKVTIIAYSMGAAVTRAMLSGCQLEKVVGNADASQCDDATSLVDTVFFVDGAQQGAWPLEANKVFGLAASLSGNGVIEGSGNPFPPILPTIQQAIYAKFQQLSGGVNANLQAEKDMTPGSDSVVKHDAVPIPSTIAIYNFYSDVQLKLGVTVLIWKLPGKATLNLGDLLMLAQDDPAQTPPMWGGGGLCDGCSSASPILKSSPAVAPYRAAGGPINGSPQYHAWVLTDPHEFDINALVPLLSVADAPSAFGAVFNSPVWHLNTPQPVTMAPGSAIQVQDATGRFAHTDIPTEILSVLTREDSLSMP
jgi:hypothetical protein